MIELYEKDMEQISNSELNMLVSQNFDGIVQHIKSSCLNYSIQLTPYSALISVRKSFMTDRSGSIVLPPVVDNSVEVRKLDAVNVKLESELINANKKYDETLLECLRAHETIQKLQRELENRDVIISKLELNLETARESAIILNKRVNDNRVKFEEDKLTIFKDHKIEVKVEKRYRRSC